MRKKMPIEMEEITPTSVIVDLVNLDSTFDDISAKREEVAALLRDEVLKLRDNIKTSEARQTEVQMQVVNTYLAVLTAKEASVVRRVSSKLKHVETNSTSKASEAVAEFLAKVDVKNIKFDNKNTNYDQDQIESKIEQTFSENNLAPVLDTELRTDPNDV